MKKILYLFAIIVGMNVLPVTSSNAQQVNININIGNQPAWGPVGYDYAHYYYFPDINVYYDVFTQVFYYPKGRRWIASRYLPNSYARYDLYYLYKVVINDPDPWLVNRYHKREYARYRGVRTQVVIRDSRDNRYNTSRSNNYMWVEPKPVPAKKVTAPKQPTTTQRQSSQSSSSSTSRKSSTQSGTSNSSTTSRRTTSTSSSTNNSSSTSTSTNSRRTATEATSTSTNNSSRNSSGSTGTSSRSSSSSGRSR